jgi:hypothetical protein
VTAAVTSTNRSTLSKRSHYYEQHLVNNKQQDGGIITTKLNCLTSSVFKYKLPPREHYTLALTADRLIYLTLLYQAQLANTDY